jgi:sulfhydrogenase subunit gamma (sulfur reductase)
MKNNDYIPRPAKIEAKKSLAADTVGLRVKLSGTKPFNFVPGQFVLVSRLGFGAVPIGITSAPSDKEYLELAIRKVGTVTAGLCALDKGDEIGIAGPFGNGLPIAKLSGKNVILITGGLGLPPLRSLVKHVAENPKAVKSLTLMNGAKTPEDLLYQDEYEVWKKFASVNLTVDRCDSSWKECVGLITKLFDKVEVKPGSVMIVCGPPVMYDAVIKRYAGKRVAESDLFLLLERRMHCGIGKCQHCTCGGKYVCLDGPVFAYSDLKYNDEAFA